MDSHVSLLSRWWCLEVTFPSGSCFTLILAEILSFVLGCSGISGRCLGFEEHFSLFGWLFCSVFFFFFQKNLLSLPIGVCMLEFLCSFLFINEKYVSYSRKFVSLQMLVPCMT